MNDPVWKYFQCPVEGCSYFTGTYGPDDMAARRALAAHLTRKKHRYSNTYAKAMACTAQIVEMTALERATRSRGALDAG